MLCKVDYNMTQRTRKVWKIIFDCKYLFINHKKWSVGLMNPMIYSHVDKFT